MHRSACAWMVVVAALAAAPACRKSAGEGAVAVTGLAAVPADAEVVISFDVGRLIDSQLVGRAVDLLLHRDPSLKERWDRLAAACQLDVGAQVRRVLLALGPAGPAAPPVLMVVTGDLPEKNFATCVRSAVGTGGGELTAKTAGGRTLYTVKDGARTVWFGYGQADTVVLGSNQDWVEHALGRGPKLATEGGLKPLLARADQAAPIWAAGRPGPIGDGLVRVTGGKMKKGPQALFASVDPSTGFRAEVGVELASEDDAKVLEQFAIDQLPTLSIAAQMFALGPLVAKITPKRTGATVTLGVSLGMEDVNQLMQAIDRPAEDPQGSAPPGAAPPDAAGKSK